jgi:hypothetical protein
MGLAGAVPWNSVVMDTLKHVSDGLLHGEEAAIRLNDFNPDWVDGIINVAQGNPHDPGFDMKDIDVFFYVVAVM